MRDAALLARDKGVMLHTHLAENDEDVAYSLATFGCRPGQYAEDLGWTGADVWHAHCVKLDPDEIALFARSRTGDRGFVANAGAAAARRSRTAAEAARRTNRAEPTSSVRTRTAIDGRRAMIGARRSLFISFPRFPSRLTPRRSPSSRSCSRGSPSGR
jgi:hypothetical protein